MIRVAIHARYSSDNQRGASIEDRPDVGAAQCGAPIRQRRPSAAFTRSGFLAEAARRMLRERAEPPEPAR
jgi:hypothetical protein